jgi:hypothetical protein
MAEGHRGAARGVLDGGEHGASLGQGGSSDQPGVLQSPALIAGLDGASGVGLPIVQSRPKPRGGTVAWSSLRSSSLIARKASAVAVSCRFSGRFCSHASFSLELGEFGNGVVPAAGAAAVIG